MFQLDMRSSRSIYEQVIDNFKELITRGVLEPDSKLPSVRELAMDAGVNPNTMQRAFAELERKGLVYSERTSGRFVTRDERVLEQLHSELSHKYYAELEEKLRQQTHPVDLGRIHAAYEMAKTAHSGQKRKDGSPYVTHCVAAADIAADMGHRSIAAAKDALADTATMDIDRRLTTDVGHIAAAEYVVNIRPCSTGPNVHLGIA